MMTLTIPSGKDEVLIGRGDAADVRIAGRTASRVHARLRQVGGGWLVEDAGSRTGTFLNGARLTAMAAVTAEDELTMGGETYRLDLPAIAVAAPVEPVEKTPAEPTGPVVPPPKAVRQMELYVPDGGEVTISDPAVIKAMQAIQRRILEKLNVAEGAVIGSGKETTARAVQFLDETLHELEYMIPEGVETAAVRQQLVDDLIGFGPISPLIRDHRISEIMINGPENVFVEHKGKLKRTPIRFADEEHLQLIIQRIVEPLGRHVDTASPMVDARLPDGSRVNAVIPPLALDGSLVTIRKFSDKKLTDDDHIRILGKAEAKEPKTETSRRVLTMDPYTMNLLKEYKKWQGVKKLEAGKFWIETDRLFTKADGTAIHPDTIGDWWDKFQKRNKAKEKYANKVLKLYKT